MKEWIYEVLAVIAISKKTQWSIFFGIFFFVGINVLGKFMADNLEFQGSMKGLEDVIGEKILRRYDRVAFGALLAFWILAFKSYKRDKRRFWQ